MTRGSLDWSKHKTGPPQPCRICGRNALMRDQHGNPCHKTCAEQQHPPSTQDTNWKE